jgi:hypothetical protein
MTGFHAYIITAGSDLSEETNNLRFFHENRQGLLRVFEIRGTSNGYFIRERGSSHVSDRQIRVGEKSKQFRFHLGIGRVFDFVHKLPVLVFDRFSKQREIASSNF